MFKKGFCSLLVSLLFSCAVFSQGFSLSGVVLDEADNSTFVGASVVVFPASDTNQKSGTVTDVDGSFSITGIAPGSYQFRVSYIGYQTYDRSLIIDSSLDLGTIKIKAGNTQLKNVTVVGQQITAQQSGDTTSFNAGAYKTNPDATAEDLMNKMPGISTTDGTIKAQGEDVKQVLVDGKPFFGDDPNAAIKNLPAEIIDRIQVFDKLSDQGQLTGFDDGNNQKTINIITRPGRNTGQFGKLFGGYGTRDEHFRDNLYAIGGNINYFKGNTRLSVIALSNNVNQQNFSTDDLLGVVGGSSGQSRGGSQGGPRGGGFRGGRGGSDGGSGGTRGGGGDAGNFLVGQQAGITTTHSAGLNYSDEWGKKMKVSGSYFFNYTTNENQSSLSRTYLTSADSNLIYKENSSTSSKNINHRANLRLEYAIDSSNTVIFTPRFSYQDNTYDRTLNGNNKLPDSSLVSATNNLNTANNRGYNFSGNLLYQHKFAKRGRTISLNAGAQMNERSGEGTVYSANSYLQSDTSFTLQDQRYDLLSNGRTWSGDLRYTEPLTERSQLMINYSPSYTKNFSDRETFDKDTNTANYESPNTALSNKFENTYITQKGGLSYRSNTQQSNFMAGINFQQASLEGTREFPTPFALDKTFTSVLPNLMYNYKFTRTQNLRIMYRTATNAPTVSQLQDVVDITNPLLLKTGNPDLQQDYQHTLILRYGNTNSATSTSFFAMLFGNYGVDYIANQTIIPNQDTVFEGITINRGSQLTRPVNLDGYWSARSFLSYGMPLKTIKTNLNLNAGFNYSKLPGLVNSTLNYANNYSLNGGAVLSSNISENLDFTLAYNGNYSIVKNTINTQSNNNYYNHTASFRFNWIFLDRFVLNSSLNQTLYSGLSQGFNQSFLLWNASLGYKFLKDKSLDVRLSAYDILNQNRAIERTVTETYIEDSYTNVLRQYFMLNLTYTLRRFGGAAPKNVDMPGGDEGRGGERRSRREGGGNNSLLPQ